MNEARQRLRQTHGRRLCRETPNGHPPAAPAGKRPERYIIGTRMSVTPQAFVQPQHSTGRRRQLPRAPRQRGSPQAHQARRYSAILRRCVSSVGEDRGGNDRRGQGTATARGCAAGPDHRARLDAVLRGLSATAWPSGPDRHALAAAFRCLGSFHSRHRRARSTACQCYRRHRWRRTAGSGAHGRHRYCNHGLFRRFAR